MTMNEVLRHWDTVRAGLVETVGLLRDEEQNFRPFTRARNVREMVLHIGHEEQIEFNHGLSQTLPNVPPEPDPASYPDRAALLGWLEAVHAPNRAFLSALGDEGLNRIIHTPWGSEPSVLDMVDHMIDHELHHRGELSLVVGLLGREGLNA
jgi:uncharacterized damage-inducible protein DinB